MLKYFITGFILVFINLSCGPHRESDPLPQINADVTDNHLQEAFEAAALYKTTGLDNDLQLLLETFTAVANTQDGLKQLANYHQNHQSSSCKTQAEYYKTTTALESYAALISTCKPHKSLKSVYELFFTESVDQQALGVKNLVNNTSAENAKLELLAVMIKLDHKNINDLKTQGVFDADLALKVLDFVPDIRNQAEKSITSANDRGLLRFQINLKNFLASAEASDNNKAQAKTTADKTQKAIPPALSKQKSSFTKTFSQSFKKEPSASQLPSSATPERFSLTRTQTQFNLTGGATADVEAGEQAPASQGYFTFVVSAANAACDLAYNVASSTFGAAASAGSTAFSSASNAAACAGNAAMFAGQCIADSPTHALGLIVGQEAAREIVAFSYDEKGTNELRNLFDEKLQPSLYMLGARQQFGDYIMKSILYPKSKIVEMVANMGSTAANKVAPDYGVAEMLDGVYNLSSIYQGLGFSLKNSDELLKEWNEAEKRLSTRDMADVAASVKAFGNTLAGMKNTSGAKTDTQHWWSSFKSAAAKKLATGMSDEAARKEAELWLTALNKTINRALLDQATAGDDKLAIFMHLLHNLGSYGMAENPLVDYLVPAIQFINNKANQKYVESQVIDAGIDLTKNLITGPIQALAYKKYPESMEFFSSYLEFDRLESFKSTIDDAHKILFWNYVKVRLFEYVSSVLYLMDTIYVEKHENNQKYWDVSFDRLLKAHLSKDLRKAEVDKLAIDHALDSLFSLAGEKREAVESMFFSSLAMVELARNTSEFANSYPPVRPVFGALFTEFKQTKEGVAKWWSLPAGDMSILFKYALSNASQKAQLVDIKGKDVSFIIDAAGHSQLTKIHGKNVAKAGIVSAGKVALSASASPLSGLLVGIFEACKLGAATQSGALGAKAMSFGLKQGKADKQVKKATNQAVTFVSTLASTIYNGFEAVPLEFKAKF